MSNSEEAMAVPNPRGCAAARSKTLLMLALAPTIAAAAGTGAIDQGLRFNSPRVLDLASRSLKLESGRQVPVATLAADDAREILAAPSVGEDPLPLSFSDDEFGCKTPSRKCSLEHERKLLDAAGATAKRDGKRLTVTPAGGAAATFVDWVVPTTKTADGDQETHWYLGRLPGSGYERVEVEFGHDAPGNFLINPQSGKVAFVHNAADVAAPSPDGKYLVTFNTLNPPLSIRVAALDAAGPRLDMLCAADDRDERSRPAFKGWRDANAFDLAVDVGDARQKQSHVVAIRASRDDAGWHLAADDLPALMAIGLACRGQ